MSHLEKDILKGKFWGNKTLKKEAREELAEERIEHKTGKKVRVREMAGKMKSSSESERHPHTKSMRRHVEKELGRRLSYPH